MSAARLVLAVLVCALISGAPTAAAAPGDPSTLGPAVADEIVAVVDGQDDRLSVAQAGALRLRIVDRAIGRIKLALVDPADVAAAGGIGPYANAVSAAMDPPLRGVLVVVAPRDAYAVTSYPESGRAVAALQRAFASQDGGEAGALERAIDGLADVDPGSGADVPVGETVPGVALDDLGFDAGGISDAVKLVLYAVAAAVLLPVLVGIAVVVGRLRRRRRAADEEAASTLDVLRDDLARLGAEIVDREPDAETPMVVRTAYDAALTAYEEASTLLAGPAPDAPTARRARAAVDDGLAAFAVTDGSVLPPARPDVTLAE